MVPRKIVRLSSVALVAGSTLFNATAMPFASASETPSVNECSLKQPRLLSQSGNQPTKDNGRDVSDTLAQLFDRVTGKYSVSEFLSKEDEGTLFAWIATETSAQKATYCYRRSYGRGAGTVLTEAGDGRVKIGALSYSQCPSNTARYGFDCHSVCPPGMRDDGLYCRRSEYGRGAGYVTRSICNRNAGNWGVSECEKYGLLFYPRCRDGYSAFGANICRPERPDCGALGLGRQIDLSCEKKVIIGDARPLVCKSGEEQDGALCYPPCRAGFHGEGPVCWQNCNSGTTPCGAGCASDKGSCASATSDQVFSSLALAANIASLGGLGVVTKAGQAAGSATVLTKSQKAYNAAKSTLNVLVRNLKSSPNSKVTKAFFVSAEATAFYNAGENFAIAYEQDMEKMTTKHVVETLKSRFGERGYKQVVRRYALRFLLVSSGELGSDVVKGLTLLDPTGVTYVIAAFKQPSCDRNTPFPDIKILSKD